ncbi:unnamed protein product [Gadus morhua 'NCC']
MCHQADQGVLTRACADANAAAIGGYTEEVLGSAARTQPSAPSQPAVSRGASPQDNTIRLGKSVYPGQPGQFSGSPSVQMYCITQGSRLPQTDVTPHYAVNFSRQMEHSTSKDPTPKHFPSVHQNLGKIHRQLRAVTALPSIPIPTQTSFQHLLESSR